MTRRLKIDEFVATICPSDGHVMILRGSRDTEKGWDLDNVKCRICEGNVDADVSRIGIRKDKILPLTIQNVIGRQLFHEHEKEQLRQFWRHKCQVWKAIDKEIQRAEPHESVFANKVGQSYIDNSSAFSGVELKKVYAHPMGAGENAKYTVRFCYNVNYRDDDEEARRPTYSDSEMVDVPVKLVTDFTEKGFAEFRESRVHLLDGMKREWQRRAVLELFERHSDLKPEDIGKLLEEARADAQED